MTRLTLLVVCLSKLLVRIFGVPLNQNVNDNPPPSHIEVCHAILNGVQDRVIVKESSFVCAGNPFSALLHMFASALLAEVSRRNGLDIWYYHGCKYKAFRDATVQQMFPPHLLYVPTETEMKLETAVSLCTMCIEEFQQNGKSSPSCVLSFRFSAEESMGIELMLPSIQQNLHHAAQTWKDHPAIPNDENFALIYLSCKRGRHCDEEDTSQQYNHIYKEQIPPHINKIDILMTPSFAQAYYDEATNLQQFLVVFTSKQVTIHVELSTAGSYSKMLNASPLLCPPGLSCLLPALTTHNSAIILQGPFLYPSWIKSLLASSQATLYQTQPAIMNTNFDEQQLKRLAKPFPTRNDNSWCIPTNTTTTMDTTTTTTPSGLIYVRIPKTGSSTISGVALRIAHRQGPPCQLEYRHRPGKTYRYRTDLSFLFASVRHPSDRALSHVFFEFVSRQQLPPNDEVILENLKLYFGPDRYKNTGAGYQVEFLTMRTMKNFISPLGTKFYDYLSPDVLEVLIREILDEYDFILISERMEESLVALQLLLNLSVEDMLYLSSKTSGGYYFDRKRENCVPIHKFFVSPTVQEYLSSPEWQMDIAGDVMLHDAANRCLDATIDQLGRQRFEDALEVYRKELKRAEEICLEKAMFPCSDKGEIVENTNCYDNDYGCGYPCLDEMAMIK